MSAIKAVLYAGRYRRAAAAMAETMARSGGLPALAAIVDAVACPTAGRAGQGTRLAAARASSPSTPGAPA